MMHCDRTNTIKTTRALMSIRNPKRKAQMMRRLAGKVR